MSRRPRASLAYIIGWLVLVAAGFVGAALLIAADFSTLHGVRALEVDLQRVTAGGHHGLVLVLIGLAALVLCGRAAEREGTREMRGVAAAGLLALLIATAVDLPALGSAAPFNQYYALATAWTGSAVALEFAGASLLIISGCGQLALYARRPRPRRARPAPATT